METPERSPFDALIQSGAEFPQIDPAPHNLVRVLAVGVSVALVLLLFLWVQ